MIVCSACGAATSVRETRSHGNYLRRRRVCDNTQCGARVTTIETAVNGRCDSEMVVVSKRDLEAIARVIGAVIGYDQIIALMAVPPPDAFDGD